MLYQTIFPMANLIDTSNNFNNQYICEPNKKWTLIDGTDIYSTKVKPALYNLPDDSYICNDIYRFEDNKYSIVPPSVINFLQNLPLKWLTKITCKYRPFAEDILVIDDHNLPESIKPYIKSYYAKCYNGKYASVIYSNIRRDSREGSLSNYLEGLDNQNENKFIVGSTPNYWSDDDWMHIFDGIELENFYKIYFKSGLSKETIFRYLKNNEYYYNIDSQAIEKEVERILNKH